MSNIEIIVSGGLIQEIKGIPHGVIVTVRDYDCDGIDESELDNEGQRCVVSVWTAE